MTQPPHALKLKEIPINVCSFFCLIVDSNCGARMKMFEGLVIPADDFGTKLSSFCHREVNTSAR